MSLNNMEHNDIQKELDQIMLKDRLLKEGDDRYAAKLVERIVFSILGLFGVAIVVKIIQMLGI